jgi:NAD(P)-dependent dehydrogenase (short-subunit alcohol dehydrogenase family)
MITKGDAMRDRSQAGTAQMPDGWRSSPAAVAGSARRSASALAAQGATVAVNYHRNAAAADETVAGIVAAGGSAKAYAASVADPDACATMVEAVLADFGPVDILVCNAGIASRGTRSRTPTRRR